MKENVPSSRPEATLRPRRHADLDPAHVAILICGEKSGRIPTRDAERKKPILESIIDKTAMDSSKHVSSKQSYGSAHQPKAKAWHPQAQFLYYMANSRFRPPQRTAKSEGF